jgi:CheY-like chemotaxis protein
MNASPPAPEATAETPVKGASIVPLRILFVDDEEALRRMVPAALVRRGHTVAVASHAREALAIFQPGKFDLVLTDFKMPGMTGDRLARTIKALAPDQPVIILTAEPEALKGQTRGPSFFDRLIDKPLTAEELIAAISEVVPRPRSTQL